MNIRSFYRAAENRCAIDFHTLQLPMGDDEALSILERRGFRKLDVSLTALASDMLKTSMYKRNCQPYEAPDFVDCSSLMQWLYAQKGISLPRHPIDQRDQALLAVPWSCDGLAEGDLIFTTGRKNLYWDDPQDAVGHVGMVTCGNTVIHAAGADLGIVEVPLDKCINQWRDRGIRRIIPRPFRTFTVLCPPHQQVEISSAFRWKILSAV